MLIHLEGFFDVGLDSTTWLIFYLELLLGSPGLETVRTLPISVFPLAALLPRGIPPALEA
jgi:hypothetical protein